MTGHLLFSTPIGRMGLAWTASGVSAVQLPEADDSQTLSRLLRKSGNAPAAAPSAVAVAATELIVRLLNGERVDLASVPLDLKTSDFNRAIYELARRIPPGETRTYGELAVAANTPGAARAVGRAMATNPIPLIIPCHRVVAAGGRLHGFSAHGGLVTKRRLLAIERGERGLFAA